jgi:hypothetical protein
VKRALLFAFAAVAGCRDATSIPPTTVTYRTSVSLPFAVTVVYADPRGPTISCTLYHTLTGNLSVTLPASGPFVDTGGRLELMQIGAGTSSDSLCGSNRDQRSSLLWTAPLRGTPTQFSLDMQQQETFTTYAQSATSQFLGSWLGDSVVGTFTFTRWGGGFTDGDVPTTSQGMASVRLVLKQ